MKDYTDSKSISNHTIEKIFNYYLNLEKGEQKSVSEISDELGYSKFSIRRFISLLDTSLDVTGEFHSHYKLILLHTKFKAGTEHYQNQQKLLKHIKAAAIARYLYDRQTQEKQMKLKG